MENNSRSTESELPEEIIQRIQSLISERDAARSTLLSRSWHRAWCTRPNLRFKQSEFRNGVVEFPRFTRKIMQRYEDLNLKIKSFKLIMMKEYDEDHSQLARELILKAIKLGAIDLWLRIPGRYRFVLPDEVLESETLAKLCVQGLTIDLQKRNKVVIFPNLKSLHLCCTTVKGDLIRDLISRCPSIEKLTLNYTTTTSLFGDERRSLHDSFEFHKLKYLRLIGMDDKLHDLRRKFPWLKQFLIRDCNGNQRNNIVRIAAHRLSAYMLARLIWNWNGEH